MDDATSRPQLEQRLLRISKEPSRWRVGLNSKEIPFSNPNRFYRAYLRMNSNCIPHTLSRFQIPSSLEYIILSPALNGWRNESASTQAKVASHIQRTLRLESLPELKQRLLCMSNELSRWRRSVEFSECWWYVMRCYLLYG